MAGCTTAPTGSDGCASTTLARLAARTVSAAACATPTRSVTSHEAARSRSSRVRVSSSSSWISPSSRSIIAGESVASGVPWCSPRERSHDGLGLEARLGRPPLPTRARSGVRADGCSSRPFAWAGMVSTPPVATVLLVESTVLTPYVRHFDPNLRYSQDKANPQYCVPDLYG